jgi:glucosylceramidase
MSQEKQNRRDVLKLAAGGIALLQPRTASAQSAAENRPLGEIAVRVTAGNKRFAPEASLRWQAERGSPEDSIFVDPSWGFQEILGFGASFTDAACYMFNQLSPASRTQLFRELFHPSEMGLSVCRLCIGSSDYATKAYSYDEGGPDPELRRFSIDHDREYVLPMLQLGRSVNPDLFLLATPWSPPGWMKAGGSMLGGSMRKSSFGVYARYLAKFVKAYSDAGLAVNALSVQNEVDTDQDGKMPACLWGQEYEMQFIADHLGPLFKKENIDAKIWILDHNYSLWGRAICELDDPEVRQYVDGVAWHGYVGEVSAMTRVHQAHPDKHMYWTEGGPSFRDPRYQTDWVDWSANFAGILRNWARCIMGWNLALDEAGKPNIGPFDCGGVVTIDSKTKEVTRSGQYWALAHYSRAVRRGARRVESSSILKDVSHVAFANPDGTVAVVLTNAGPQRKATLRMAGMETAVNLPADSVSTLTWR